MTAHIVLFQPRADATPPDRAAFAESLARACRDIPSVRRALVGRAADIDAGYARSLGPDRFDYAAVLEFDDRAGLVAYLRHPLHQDLGQRFWRLCERTAIVEVDLIDARTDDLARAGWLI